VFSLEWLEAGILWIGTAAVSVAVLVEAIFLARERLNRSRANLPA
jgi:hypothetical protein